MKKFDYLIVGSGLFGSVCAFELTKQGFSCVVIEKRNHKGGNVYTESIEGINVHKYGAHIFHTNDKSIWEYVNSFCEFNRFTNAPVANFEGKLYNLPFNMNTFYQLWGVITPEEAREKIRSQVNKSGIQKPKNLEEQAISMVGIDIYEKLIKHYTKKQWGRDPKDLPGFIIKRLPLRFTFDNNYFNDKYQGIPIGGYNQIIDKMLDGIEIHLNTDYFENKKLWDSRAKKIIYTGPIDRFFNYQYGKLQYRSLRFENEIINTSNFQGNAVVNYTDSKTEFTRIIEHKHFEFGTQEKTIITKEYPREWSLGEEPYYPVNDETNNHLYKLYSAKSESLDNVIFGGRLAQYKYYDMHQVIGAALKTVKTELSNK